MHCFLRFHSAESCPWYLDDQWSKLSGDVSRCFPLDYVQKYNLSWIFKCTLYYKIYLPLCTPPNGVAQRTLERRHHISLLTVGLCWLSRYFLLLIAICLHVHLLPIRPTRSLHFNFQERINILFRKRSRCLSQCQTSWIFTTSYPWSMASWSSGVHQVPGSVALGSVMIAEVLILIGGALFTQWEHQLPIECCRQN